MLTHSAPFLYCNECGIQNVADIIPPLSPNVGFAARGSSSVNDALLALPPVKLMRRSISWFDFAPDAASVGDCAIVSRSLLISCEKYDVVGRVLLSDEYSPRLMPGVTGTFTRDGRRPGCVSSGDSDVRSEGSGWGLSASPALPSLKNLCDMVSIRQTTH